LLLDALLPLLLRLLRLLLLLLGERVWLCRRKRDARAVWVVALDPQLVLLLL
jgi:hypothetical protein